VDPKALESFHKWLKQWKLDIKDDGGTSRKLIEKKRKRRDSESDFVTSNDDDAEMRKKSVILSGPSGCGKTTTIYVVAEQLGFKVCMCSCCCGIV